MIRRCSKFLALAIVLALPLVGCPNANPITAPAYRIHGTIRSLAGAPVSASISVQQGTQPVASARSDPTTGEYAIEGLGAGTADVTVGAPEFRPARQTVTIPTEGPVDFQLRPES